MAFTDSEVEEMISEILSETQWVEESDSLTNFMGGFGSAQLISLAPQGRDINVSPADLLHPFLAFSRRRRTKVYAENLVWDEQIKKYSPKGPPLEIPKDYLGWFEVVRQGVKKDQSCQITVGAVVQTKCKHFLLRTTAIGHLAADNNNEGDFQLGEEVRLYPGEILEVGEIITKKWKMQAVGPEASNKKAKEAETKFLQCMDKKKREVYLPLAHPGQFFALWDTSMKGKHPRADCAYYIYDLLTLGFPLMVRVVFGWPPADYPEFSGFMRLIGVNRPDTLILRSLRPKCCAIVELPIDADVRIEKMKNPEILSGNRTFERLLGHSCDRIYPYLIGMKHMDTKYPVLKPIQEDGDKPTSTESPRRDSDHSRMARPRDMKQFNPLDIFPPLDEPIRKVSETWTLSFKDPDYQSNGYSELRDSESVIMDPEADAEGGTGYRQLGSSRQQSLIGTVQNALMGLRTDAPISPPRRDQMWHKRADMEQVLLDREADC